MTTQELRSRIHTSFSGYGQWKVSIRFRNNWYSCTTNNSMAIDRMNDDDIDHERYYVTTKQALIALWDECKSKNSLS